MRPGVAFECAAIAFPRLFAKCGHLHIFGDADSDLEVWAAIEDPWSGAGQNQRPAIPQSAWSDTSDGSSIGGNVSLGAVGGYGAGEAGGGFADALGSVPKRCGDGVSRRGRGRRRRRRRRDEDGAGGSLGATPAAAAYAQAAAWAAWVSGSAFPRSGARAGLTRARTRASPPLERQRQRRSGRRQSRSGRARSAASGCACADGARPWPWRGACAGGPLFLGRSRECRGRRRRAPRRGRRGR